MKVTFPVPGRNWYQVEQETLLDQGPWRTGLETPDLRCIETRK